MKKKKIIIAIIIVLIIVIGCVGFFIYSSQENSNNSGSGTSSASSSTSLFSSNESALYYKLEQAVGDIGMPSNSITVNLNNTVTVNGETYYKVYNYATRAAYTTPKIYEGYNDNFSQLIAEPVYVSESGNTLTDESSDVSNEYYSSLDKLTESEQYTSIHQIVAEYVEGYTANNPEYKLSKNDNYEGNLNDAPTIKIDLNNYKTIENIKCYEATVSLNSKEITIYAALDGYIYIPSKTSFEELFFPAYENENVTVESIDV